MRVLAVPATTVSLEHIFSETGILINKLRNKSSSDSVIHLNKNKIPHSYIAEKQHREYHRGVNCRL
jgi:hypothetical protein